MEYSFLAVHPRIRFTPTEGPAANQTCGPHYVSCGGVAPSAPGPTGKPPNWGVSLCWDSAPRWERPRKTFTLARRGTERRSRRSLFPASAGGHLFPALHLICPHKKSGRQLLSPCCYLCAAPGSSLTRRTRLCLRFFRACEDKLSSLGLRPSTPQAFGKGLTETFNALRVWFTALFGPAASLSFFLHSVACGGVGCRGTPLPLRVWVYSFG